MLSSLLISQSDSDPVSLGQADVKANIVVVIVVVIVIVVVVVVMPAFQRWVGWVIFILFAQVHEKLCQWHGRPA